MRPFRGRTCFTVLASAIALGGAAAPAQAGLPTPLGAPGISSVSGDATAAVTCQSPGGLGFAASGTLRDEHGASFSGKMAVLGTATFAQTASEPGQVNSVNASFTITGPLVTAHGTISGGPIPHDSDNEGFCGSEVSSGPGYGTIEAHGLSYTATVTTKFGTYYDYGRATVNWFGSTGYPAGGDTDLYSTSPAPPVNVSPPTISGTPSVGQTLTCNQGSWIGGSALSQQVEWLRDGSPLGPPSYLWGPAQHLVTATDNNHWLACRMTVAHSTFSAKATSKPIAIGSPATPRPPDPPAIGSASISPATFAVNLGGASEVPVKALVPKGTTFAYGLSRASRVLFAIQRVNPGRVVGGDCVAQTASNASKPSCPIYVDVGRFAQQGKAGANTKKFSGKIGTTVLKAGSYRATLVATDSGGRSSLPKRLPFKIVKG